MNEALCVYIYFLYIHIFVVGDMLWHMCAPTEGDFIYIYFIFKGCLHAQGPLQAVVRGAESLEKEVTVNGTFTGMWEMGMSSCQNPVQSSAGIGLLGKLPESYWDILGSAGILLCPEWWGMNRPG